VAPRCRADAEGTRLAPSRVREGRRMYPYGISIGGIVLLIVLIMLLTGRI
jgi:hypothetical protein